MRGSAKRNKGPAPPTDSTIGLCCSRQAWARAIAQLALEKLSKTRGGGGDKDDPPPGSMRAKKQTYSTVFTAPQRLLRQRPHSRLDAPALTPRGSIAINAPQSAQVKCPGLGRMERQMTLRIPMRTCNRLRTNPGAPTHRKKKGYSSSSYRPRMLR